MGSLSWKAYLLAMGAFGVGVILLVTHIDDLKQGRQQVLRVSWSDTEEGALGVIEALTTIDDEEESLKEEILPLRRDLSSMEKFHTPPAENANLDSVACIGISSLQDPIDGQSQLIIPRGECYEVDTDVALDFPDGVRIEGKLYIPGTHSFDLSTTFVFVLGILKIDPPATGKNVRFNMYGEDLVTYTAPSFGMPCDAGCEFDSKVIAVLGGQLDIRGYDPNCPTWEKLTNSDPSSNRIQTSVSAASCWGVPGTQILLTSHTRSDEDKQVVTVVDSDPPNGIITVDTTLQEPITVADDPTYAVEIASLNRPVVFEAVENSSGNIGGHLIIHHTSAHQHIEGVQIQNFGQLGRLGRYPIHFHMSGDHPNSMVSRNVVRDSNQRGYVVHETNQVTLEDNVALNVVGHCYFLEAGTETGNTFTRNLAAGVKVMDRGISDSLGKKNDNGAAAFWISNAENSFYGNVAAGGENGYWFDTRGSTLRRTNVIAFEDNEVHSARATAFRTYNPGWRPTRANIIKNLKVYRNPAMGAFIHVSQNQVFEGGLFADNGEQAVFISRADNIKFDGTTFIGQSFINPAWCRSFWSKVGISLHPRAFNEWNTQGYYKGTTLVNVQFLNWTQAEGDCADGASFCCAAGQSRPLDFNTDDIFAPQFTAPHYFEDVYTDGGFQTTLDACAPAQVNGLNDMSLEVVSDVHHSFSDTGGSGFLVGPKISPILPASSCTPYGDNCLEWCAGQCFRTITVRTGDSPMPEDVQMIVTDDLSGASITIDRGERINDDIHRFDGFFGVSLPLGSFTATFTKQSTNEIVWPGFVTPVFEKPPACSSHIMPGDLSFNIPPSNRPACSSLIHNGDFEAAGDGLDGWAQNRGIGLHVVDDAGVDGTAAGVTSNWKSKSHWPYQAIDTSCLTDGDTFDVEISYLKASLSTGTPVHGACTSDCPKARLWYQSWTPSTGRYTSQKYEDILTSVEYENGGFNKMVGTWTVSADLGAADKVLFFIETGSSYDLIFDNIQITKSI